MSKAELLKSRHQIQQQMAAQKEKLKDAFEKIKRKGKINRAELSKLGISDVESIGISESSERPALPSHKVSPPAKVNKSPSPNKKESPNKSLIEGKHSAKKDSPKKDSPKKDSPKKESPKKESPRKESPKKQSPKKDAKKEAQKKVEKPIDKEWAIGEAKKLREKLSKELLDVLEFEQKQEDERDKKLAEQKSNEEKQKLEKEFGIERARASNRIIAMSNKHEEILKKRIGELGITDADLK